MKDKAEEQLKERIKSLEELLSSSTLNIWSTSSANSGKIMIFSKIPSVASSKVKPKCSWILNNGATHHITPIIDSFTPYVPCMGNRKLQSDEGTLLPVAGLGTITIEPLGKLEHVLHVPKLFISLNSV